MKAQPPGFNRQTSDNLTSARAGHETSYLLVPGVGVLTYARRLACKDCVPGLPFQTKLALSQFPIQTCHILSTNKPCFVRYFVCGGRYFVYGQNYPISISDGKLPHFDQRREITLRYSSVSPSDASARRINEPHDRSTSPDWDFSSLSALSCLESMLGLRRAL